MIQFKRVLTVLVLCVLASCNTDPETVAPTIVSAINDAYRDTQALKPSLSGIEIDTAVNVIATLHDEHFIQTTSNEHELVQLLATLADVDNALEIAAGDSPSSKTLSTARTSVKKLIAETATFIKKSKDGNSWTWEVDALASVANNPLYKESGNQGVNPLYEGKSDLRILGSNPATISGSCDADVGTVTLTFTNPLTGASVVSKPTSSQFSTLIDSMINKSDDATVILIGIKIAPLNNGLEGTRVLNCRFHAEQSSSGGVGAVEGSPLTDAQAKEIQQHKDNVKSLDLQYADARLVIESKIESSTDSIETKLRNLGLLARANNAWVRSTHAHKTLLLIGESGRISPEIIDIALMNLATDQAVISAATDKLARENTMFSSISNVLKSRHDAVKSILNVIR